MDEHELGYMKATVEQNTKEISRLAELLETHVKKTQEDTEEIKVCMRQLRDELNTYKTIIRFLKALGWTAAFILAFKFGDIAELWEKKP